MTLEKVSDRVVLLDCRRKLRESWKRIKELEAKVSSLEDEKDKLNPTAPAAEVVTTTEPTTTT